MPWPDHASAVYLAAFALAGLCLGSLINVVVHRLPARLEHHWWEATRDQLQDVSAWRRRFSADRPETLTTAAYALDAALDGPAPVSWVRSRSRCPHCHTALRWWMLIPLVSWALLRGRCSTCSAPISLRYPLVETAGGFLCFAAAWHWGPTPQALVWSLYLLLLLTAALVDADTLLLPDQLTYPLLWAGLGSAALGWVHPAQDAVLGAMAGYGSLWFVATAFRLVTGREGMGSGDFKFLAAIGAWIGPWALIPVVLMASILGTVAGLVVHWQRRGDPSADPVMVPFGPFLAAAGALVAFGGADRLLFGLLNS